MADGYSITLKHLEMLANDCSCHILPGNGVKSDNTATWKTVGSLPPLALITL